jgi:uncharacterized membrane protein YtjA (UPF0391 family)
MNEETGRRRRWWTWLGAVLMVLPCPLWLVFAALGIGGLGGGAATRGNPVLSTVFIVISVVGLLLTVWRGAVYLRRRQQRTSV